MIELSRYRFEQIAFLTVASKGVGSGVMPAVAAVAPEPAELDIVAVAVTAITSTAAAAIAGERREGGKISGASGALLSPDRGSQVRS